MRPGRFGCFRLLLLSVLLLAAAGHCSLTGTIRKKNRRRRGRCGRLFLADAFPAGSVTGAELVNLALQEGVTVTADSVETEAFSPEEGGGRETGAMLPAAGPPPMRAGQPVHWLMFDIRGRKTGFLRAAVLGEAERGGLRAGKLSGTERTGRAAAEITESPEANEQCIVLDNPVPGRYFRIRTTAVSDSEENQYLYYQNVSLLEAELYEEVPLSYSLGELSVGIRRRTAAAAWSLPCGAGGRGNRDRGSGL